MRVAVIVDPEVAPVTEMRSPEAIELTATDFATVTRVAFDVSTFTAVFDAASCTVSAFPAIDAIVPNVSGRPPGPLKPPPTAGVDAPVDTDALAFFADNAFAPKNPPTTRTNTPTPTAHPTHPGRRGADRDASRSTEMAPGSMGSRARSTGSSSGSLGKFMHRVSTHHLRVPSQSSEESMRTPSERTVDTDRIR
jgi:hypothetical protein